jgi:tRNA A37 threonylcarbamoyladenosine synthetase subunit TsaC/SUA5/YrdC
VALRWANSKVACEIINAVGGPITGTSANLTGMPACTNAADLIIQLGDRLPLILDSGDTRAVVPSTIVRLEGDEWMIIREGAIAENDIQKTLAA